MKKILGLILGAGFVFRLLYLGRRQLWTDELLQALLLRTGSVSGMLLAMRDRIGLPAPLDSIIQKGFVLLLGESAWVLRLHAVLFGTLSIWVFFRIARSLFGDRVALYSTVLFAFFPLLHRYSQEAQPYALLTFLTLVSFELLLRAVARPSGNWRRWLAVAGSLVGLLYTSYLGTSIIVTQLSCLTLAAFAGSRPIGSSGAHETATGGLPCVTWKDVLLYGLCALFAATLFIPWAILIWSRPVSILISDLLYPRLPLRLFKELGDNSYAVTALLFAGVVTGIRALRRHGRRQSLIWLTGWFVFAIPAVLVLDYLSGNGFMIAQILPAVPALLLLAGYGLSYVGERLTILEELPIQVSSPSLVFATGLLLMAAFVAYSHRNRELADWAGVAGYLQDTVKPGELLTIPEASALIEYYAPALSEFRNGDPDVKSYLAVTGRTNRAIVVCANGLIPDPCAGVRSEALKDRRWSRRPFRGISVFIRQE